MVISAAAPLTIVAGVAPLAMLIGGVAAPMVYVVAGIVLIIFAIAFMAMTRHVKALGGFYTYITEALGRRVGLGSSFVALVSYNVLQIGLYGMMGQAGHDLLNTMFGIDVPWWIIAAVALFAVFFVAWRGIDVGAKVLAVLLIAETLILVLLSIAILAQGGAEGITFGSFDPANLFNPGMFAVLGMGFAAFMGFESTALYARRHATPTERFRARPTSRSSSWRSSTASSCGRSSSGSARRTSPPPWPRTQQASSSRRRAVPGHVGRAHDVRPDRHEHLCVAAGVPQRHQPLLLLARPRRSTAPRAVRDRCEDQVPRRGGTRPDGARRSGRRALRDLRARPYRQLLLWVNTPGVLGIIALQALTCVAVVVYFVRNRQLPRAWYVIPAAVVAGLAMTGIVILLCFTFDLLTAAGPVINGILIAITPAAFLVGVILASVWRRRRPELFERIGGHRESTARD